MPNNCSLLPFYLGRCDLHTLSGMCSHEFTLWEKEEDCKTGAQTCVHGIATCGKV